MGKQPKILRTTLTIHGNASGNAFQIGDDNYGAVQVQPDPHLRIAADLNAVRSLLQEIDGIDKLRVAELLSDTENTAGTRSPDPDVIGSKLERALRYARAFDGFAKVADRLGPVIGRCIDWLGDHWAKLL